MNRTRLVFLALIGLAAFGVAISAFAYYGLGYTRAAPAQQGSVSQSANPSLATPAVTVYVQPTATAAVASAVADISPTPTPMPTATSAPAVTASKVNGERLKPIWGPNYKEDDGLGRLVCGAYAFAGDYPLQQIQMAGLDVKRGFHLGIVPFYLNENYVVTAKERTDAMANGQIDCLLTTFDLFALEDPGIVTGFINESAGADQMWARDIQSLNDLKGKRIAFEANGPSEFFVLDLLAAIQLLPQDVTLVPQPNQDAAIAAFNNAEADAVAGWEPSIFDAEQGGGQLLASSKDFRSILGAIVMSKQAVADKSTVIQLFHDAWFEALAQQESDFDAAAVQIAAWGHNDYLGVPKEGAAEALRTLLGGVAQANLADNARAFAKVSSVIDRLLQTRKLWSTAGHKVPTSDVTRLVDARFVQAAAAGLPLDLNRQNRFVNNTFTLGRSQLTPAVATSTQAGPASGLTQQDIISSTRAVATLPCSRFEFVPNETALQPASQQELRECAVDVLAQNVTLYVRVKGSSAWPGPPGKIPRVNVESTAKERAQAVIDFLVSQGISRDRFLLDWTMPPQDHWETTDLTKQAQDRFVEIVLLASGL
jgi:ABC-type nitrate/sulfonate/bicarbonate transport system substrate-binding protein